MPYTKGFGESFKNIYSKHGIQVHFKGGRTIMDLLDALKDKDTITQKSGVIYRLKCDRVVCDEYIEESTRTSGERLKEQLKASFSIYEHSNTTGHHTSLNSFSIVGRESQNLMRTIKEAIFIRVTNPFLNRNLENTNCHIFWIGFCSTPQNSSSNGTMISEHLFFTVSNPHWGWAMAHVFWLNLAWSSSRCPADNHGQVPFKMDKGWRRHTSHIWSCGIDLLTHLAWCFFLWLLLIKGVPWLMRRSQLNLTWYKSTSRCSVDSHEQVTQRLGRRHK